MKTFFVPFEGQDFPLVQTDDGRFYVPLKPICAAIGASWAGQEKKMYRGDAYKCVKLNVRALDQGAPTHAIPAIRLFGWLRSFYQGLAKSPESQALNAKFADQFVEAVESAITERYLAGAIGSPENTDDIDDRDWRFSAIEARLDRVEKAMKRRSGEG